MKRDHPIYGVDEAVAAHLKAAYPETAKPAAAALATQIGGAHYKDRPIQPVEYNQVNKLGFIEGNIVKYATRHQHKGKAEDVRKIIHYAKLLLQLEYGVNE